MRRLNIENINTTTYFNNQFEDKAVDMENTLRQDKYLEILSGYDIQSVVELGCGVSAFLPKAREQYLTVWGMDFSSEAIQKMRKEFPNIFYVLGDATDSGFDDEEFDAVVSGELLEHLERPQRLIDEMARICSIGGVMLLSTPVLEFLDKEHVWEFTPEDLVAFMSPYGKPIVETLHSEKFPGRKYFIAYCVRVR